MVTIDTASLELATSESITDMSKAERLISELVEDIWKELQKAFPDWALGDLKDIASSTSPSMSADAKKVWKKYQELKKKSK